ncbi:uncharacterized protein N7483_000439 [Penicillium malachiteum]|uniref:uncharacterized protein n=1 Tax=Penicillium malachiteum TaxID=1324776 RepID=UPI002546BA37|nr:uncharacterized protein N7483_000439 [Penicillium malachiteum]KAJ5735314.1 hypothetical protein N7483_000439 [Penicillium malachiteum]
MSSTSRSQTSSPDILGPPGDAEYLISSPVKQFSGRQSWMSPALVKRQQTPAKRPRASLSPGKSAHSIRFDDVLLPRSPAMKLDGRHRSISPEKILQDGNVSPWRIRVTLEATQDEENQDQNSPSRKRRRPSTVTTMVPLKDERSPLMEKTPPRKRGRPRKSDTQPRNGSPWPGSPGHTPGPNEASGQKRKPGRPRKSTPRPLRQDLFDIDNAPSPEPQSEMHMSPMDMTADVAAEPVRQWSPINTDVFDELESDSLGADDLPVADLRPLPPAHSQTWDDSNRREYGRATYDTPVIGETEHHFQDNEESIHSTPSKMPSPTPRERLGSSTRSSRLGGSTSSPGTYPTPTPTSSLVEGENRARENNEQVASRDTVQPHPTTDPLADPTEDHEEFDSIMESEGFTMVSLDTLPSARQYGLGSGARNATDNAAKILRDREDGRIGDKLKRRLPGSIRDLRSDTHSSARPSPLAQVFSPGRASLSSQNLNSFDQRSRHSADLVSYPELPETMSPEKSPDHEPSPHVREEPDYFLDGVEESGSRIYEQEEEQEEEIEELENEYEEEDEEEPAMLESPQLSDRSPQQYNPADLRRTRESQWQMEREIVSRQAANPVNSNQVIYVESDENTPESENNENEDLLEDLPHSDAQLNYEEQQPFDQHSVDEDYFIEERFHEQSQDRMPQNLSDPLHSSGRRFGVEQEQEQDNHHEHGQQILDDDDDSVDIWQQEQNDDRDDEVDSQPEPEPYRSAYRETHVQEEMGVGEEETEEGFDDIWQQEARDHSFLSQHSDDDAPPPVQESTTPWKKIGSAATRQNNLSSSPAYVAIEHDGTKHLEQTHIQKLRDQEVDLSAILGEEDTPNRARYFNGSSTPKSILKRRIAAPYSSINGSGVRSIKSEKRVRLQPISQSPEPDFHAEINSPPVHESPHVGSASGRVDYSDATHSPEVHDTQSLGEQSAITPEHTRHAQEGEPSSWFRRITSLTPRWLKAPTRSRYDSSSDISEDEPDDYQSDQDEPGNDGSAHDIREDPEHEPLRSPLNEYSTEQVDESAGAPSMGEGHMSLIEMEEDQFAEQEESDDAIEPEPEAVDLVENSHDKLQKPRPLAVFGYFSDAHYTLLRRVYRMAKRHPERFPYFDAPGRADIIGDWMWTSDGHHGVPITEVQFAVIDRFVHELSHADIEYGGSGQVDWTEADLHRRLISVIIGEQIREERKSKTARGMSVDTWR